MIQKPLQRIVQVLPSDRLSKFRRNHHPHAGTCTLALEMAVGYRHVCVRCVMAEDFVAGSTEGAGDVPEGESSSKGFDDEADGGAGEGHDDP